MKETNFLNKLAKQGRLQLVESSNEVKEAYLQRGEESLVSAKTLLNISNLKDSVALAYYSMYHTLLALLFRCGIKCENHTAAIILLKEIFEMDNTSVLKAKAERVDKQYYVDFEITKEEVTDAIIIAEEFISHIHTFLATLNEEDIKKYRKKIKTTVDFNTNKK